FDLDLTYITDRVIAMAAPAFGQHSAYRNDIYLMSRFFATRHYGFLLILLLTPNPKPQPQPHRVPFEDHGPPLLAEILHLCEHATAWLQKDPHNVVALHCKGGKGRTGVMTAALLLW
ncbi:protein-tyrosine phosphatase-like protein, partial [Baffinella frigidus]